MHLFRLHVPTTLLLSTLALSLPTQNAPTWTPLAPIPSPRQEHTTVFLPPSTIAILGGIVPVGNDTGLVPPVNTTSLMQFYDLDTNTWSNRAALPQALNHLNAAVVDGKIYVLGGLAETHDPEQGGRTWRPVHDAYVYDPSTDLWTTLPPFPSSLPNNTTEENNGTGTAVPSGSAATIVYNSTIYLAGGLRSLDFYGALSQNSTSSVVAFDTASSTWLTSLPPRAANLPAPRDHAAAAVVGSTFYVLGGRAFGQNNVKDTVFALDLADLERGWRTSGARMPTARGGVAAGVVGGVVYTFGGEGNRASETGVFDQVEGFVAESETWVRAGSMRVPRHGTYAVGVEGRGVYVPGGGVRQGGEPVADFDVFVP